MFYLFCVYVYVCLLVWVFSVVRVVCLMCVCVCVLELMCKTDPCNSTPCWLGEDLCVRVSDPVGASLCVYVCVTPWVPACVCVRDPVVISWCVH